MPITTDEWMNELAEQERIAKEISSRGWEPESWHKRILDSLPTVWHGSPEPPRGLGPMIDSGMAVVRCKEGTFCPDGEWRYEWIAYRSDCSHDWLELVNIKPKPMIGGHVFTHRKGRGAELDRMSLDFISGGLGIGDWEELDRRRELFNRCCPAERVGGSA